MAQSRRAVVWSICGCLVWLGLATGRPAYVQAQEDQSDPRMKELEAQMARGRARLDKATRRAAELGLPPKSSDTSGDLTPDGFVLQRGMMLLEMLEDFYYRPEGRVARLIKSVAEAGRPRAYTRYTRKDLRGPAARADFDLFCMVLHKLTAPATPDADELQSSFGDAGAAWLLGSVSPTDAFAAIIHARRLNWYLQKDRDSVRDYFESAYVPERRHVRDFTVYELFLKRRGELQLGTDEDMERLVGYMFRTDCVEAMEVMLRLEGKLEYDASDRRYVHQRALSSEEPRRPPEETVQWKRLNIELQANRELARLDADLPEKDVLALTNRLGVLLTHPQWWVRLYAVEAMRQVPSLRNVKLVKPLLKDDHPEVRASVTSLIEAVRAEEKARKRKEEIRRRREAAGAAAAQATESDSSGQ